MSIANRPLPPEFLAALQGGMGAPPMPGPPPGNGGGPQIAPGVPMDPMGLPQPGGPVPTMSAQMPPPMAPPPPPPMPVGPPPDQDPIATAMLQMAPATPPPPVKKGPKKGPKPNITDIIGLANSDKRLYNARNVRMARDNNIFRQYESGVPSQFDPSEDVRWISAAMSNLVNRLANMMGGLEVYIEAPYRDEQTEKSSQIIEDALYHCRDYERRTYAIGGGNSLQRDEFFYLFLRGWIAARELPDLEDDDYPFTSALVDPATVYPIWGDDKEGLVRVSRIYNSSVAELLSTYERYSPKLRENLIQDVASEGAPGEYLSKQYTVIEYWDKFYRGVVTRDGVEVFPVKEHGLSKVPWVIIPAVGEPKGMQSPDGDMAVIDPVYGPSFNVANSRHVDLAQKGVSVLHYLINTHRLKEALFTLLYAEVEKASNPPTIRYRAPQLFGTEVPDVDYKIGGTNEGQLGIDKLEGLPTSPHPTDVSPLMQDSAEGISGGGLNAAAQGQEMGANASGYSLDTLIASAKELVLPYLQSYENFLMLKFGLKLEYARDVVLPNMSFEVPNQNYYGGASSFSELTLQNIQDVGTIVQVRVKNINDQNRPAITRSAIERMQAGIISQRMAMDETGVRNPNKAFAEILSEQALQHPMIRDMFSIPSALQARGADELMQLWMQMVVMPQLMQSGMMGQGGQQPPGGGQSPPPTQGGQQNPMQGGAPPGGPQPGQGRQ